MFDAKRDGRNRTCQRVQRDGTQEISIQVQKAPVTNPYELKAKFFTTVAASLINQKLAGFVDANHAKLANVTPDGFQMTVGESTLFGGWGTALEKQPIQIVVEVGAVDRTRTTNRVEIKITITPLARKPSLEVFLNRAVRARDEIRDYCAADQEVAK